MIGQVLSGNYRLTDLVGSGGYADVYLARDLRTNTIVAVKILHAHVARDPDVAARFEREASFARRLQTPYVARVLDAGQDPTTPPFMVMEFVQGLTVAELIRRNGPFSIPEAVEIADQLLSALASAHALGIIHRDIKPQNLMIDAERRLKVLDFGVARLAGAGTMTASGHLLGTPEYMASEQVDGRPVDHRTDLYAAGAVLYQLLTGRPPYLRDATSDIWELIRRVRAESPPPIRQLRPDCPPALAAVVERAMAKEPARRYQSALEMRQALAAAMGTAPTPPPATRIMGAPPMGQSPPFQHPPVPSPAGQSPAGPYSPGAPTPGPYLTGPYGPGPAAPGPYPPRQGTGGPFTPSPPVPPSPGPANGGGGMPAWKIAGLAAGALVLIVLGVAVGRMVPLPGASTPTPTALAAATPTRAAPTATSGAAKVSSPAAEGTSQARSPVPSPTAPIAVNPTSPPKPTAPPTPPPSPTVPPKPTLAPGVLLADNFDRPEIGQLRRESARPNDYTFAYEAGEYVIRKINATLPTAPIVFLPGSYDNSVIAVDTRLMGNVASRYTFVVCRDQSTDGQAKQYRASLVPEERRLILSRWDAGTQRVLAEARDDPAIQPGSAKNRLELRCAGAKISASVNGRVVASADDLTLNRGDHGLGTGTFQGVDGTIEARFDNLEVRSP